jgi:protein-S-isoprenylcysteine O-methyltransferase Ste14
MCISSACAAKRFYEELFATGICIIVIGILAWIWFHVQYPGAKRPVRKEAQPPSVRVRAPPSPSAIPQYRS